jgi:DNA polymerase III subunit gamma/tau
MLSLYNKYRPKKFSSVSSQDYTVAVLKNSVELKKIAHAYLFAGSKGTGKTTLARIFAKAVNCENPQKGEPCGKCKNCRSIESGQSLDITEIDAASHTGVDNIRELKENINVLPSTLKYKIYIIDEAHMLSKGAFNALLKSLEEPPEFVIFILATTEIHKIPPTIISRCQRFDFKRIPNKQIFEKLRKIAQKEKIKISQQALIQIASSSDGGMRDAESLLDQIINLDQDKKINSQEVRDLLGVPSTEKFYGFVKAIADKDIQKGFQLITKLAYSGYDIKNYLKSLIDYFRDILIFKINSTGHKKILADKLTEEDLNNLIGLSEKMEINFIGKSILELISAKNLIDDSPLPHLPLELALVKIIGEENIKLENKNEEKVKKEDEKGRDKGKKQKNRIGKAMKEKIQEIKKTSRKILRKRKNKNKSKSEKKFRGDTITLKEVSQAWPKIVDGLKPFNHSLWGIIQNCQPIGVDEEGDIIVQTKYDFYKAKLEEPKNRKLITKIAKKVLALNCSFCYFLEDEIPSKFKKRTNKTATQELLDEFGGEIV